MKQLRRAVLVLATIGWLTATAAPPAAPREFRGLWIATVGNIDWPSHPGQAPAFQQAEFRQLLDGAKNLNLNVVVFQVRTSCEAMYESALEPWSEYLTGRMGQEPNPKWDPLEFAVTEAHSRGLELHAWFNPFRVRYHQTLSAASANHISHTHPGWVRAYGRYQWLDPGEPQARDYTLNVIRDVVHRYDIDGVHLDDYFYPYPEYAPGFAVPIPFPDSATYARYRRDGGTLELADWRRENVNGFISKLYEAVHAEKAWVKVGISPFGIWRPNAPAGIKGLDAYATLYADARRWIESGWCDYLAPQLYWPLGRREQNFESLLTWWTDQNREGRLVVAGLSPASIGKDRAASDIADQIRVVRDKKAAAGMVFWNASSLRDNLGGITTGLRTELLARPALLPETPWLGAAGPPAPRLSAELAPDGLRLTLTWSISAAEPTRQLLLQARSGDHWAYEIAPPSLNHWEFDRRRGQVIPDEVWVAAVGRSAVLSEAAVWTRPARTAKAR